MRELFIRQRRRPARAFAHLIHPFGQHGGRQFLQRHVAQHGQDAGIKKVPIILVCVRGQVWLDVLLHPVFGEGGHRVRLCRRGLCPAFLHVHDQAGQRLFRFLALLCFGHGARQMYRIAYPFPPVFRLHLRADTPRIFPALLNRTHGYASIQSNACRGYILFSCNICNAAQNAAKTLEKSRVFRLTPNMLSPTSKR